MDTDRPPERINVEPGDADVLARIRAGDTSAFEAVFREHAAALADFALRYVRSRETAADVVQDVFLNVWQHRASWRTPGSIKSYLFASVRNRALDVLKHGTVAERWAEQVAYAELPETAPASVEEVLDANDLNTALERALALLPERRRRVFLFRFKAGLSYAEIAEVMGTTTKTVENQVSRALKSLREQLGEFAP